MQTFIIINGTSCFFIKAENMGFAQDHAIAICNHSLEIIVREIKMTDLVTKGIREFINEDSHRNQLLKDLDENWNIGFYTKDEYMAKRSEILFS